MQSENQENLLKLVYGNDDPKYPVESVVSYLEELCSYGLDKSTKEPDRIGEEKQSVVQQSRELAYQNYPTFIETAQSSKGLISNFSKIDGSTVELAGNLEKLKARCSEFSEKAKSLNGARRLTSLALSRHTQLLEILELPQLMDTCVRNGYWEEALELSAYVSRLERKLGHIPLISSIAQEVQSCTRLMLSQLIGQLRMPAQLPHCLKVMGYLRRIGVFSEEELRLKFLQARDSWFRSTLSEIPRDDAYQHILKTIEASRIHLFDIATQYRAIFSDEDPLILANQDPSINECGIFHSWIVQKVRGFVSVLETDLARLSPTFLESVLGQCMYFGLSFGRIGFDFRALLMPAFVQVVRDRFDHAVATAEMQFANSVASISLSRASSLGSVPAVTSTVDQLQPPYALMEFRPLAELCNGLISAFSDLRLCAPLTLVDHVVHKLSSSLHNCAQLLADFYRHEQEAFSATEKKNFSRFLQLFSSDFLGYLQKVIDAVFPPTQLALQASLTTNELQKQGLGVLETDKILKSIEQFVKSKTDSFSSGLSAALNQLSVNDEAKPETVAADPTVPEAEKNSVEQDTANIEPADEISSNPEPREANQIDNSSDSKDVNEESNTRPPEN